MSNYIVDQIFESVDFSTKELSKEYEQCTFNNCQFNAVNLSEIAFTATYL